MLLHKKHISDTEMRTEIECPICGCPGLHIRSAGKVESDNDYGVLVLRMDCESGHEWDYIIRSHEGTVTSEHHHPEKREFENYFKVEGEPT